MTLQQSNNDYIKIDDSITEGFYLEPINESLINDKIDLPIIVNKRGRPLGSYKINKKTKDIKEYKRLYYQNNKDKFLNNTLNHKKKKKMELINKMKYIVDNKNIETDLINLINNYIIL